MNSPRIRDDGEAFFTALGAGVPLRVLVAPVAVRHIPDFPRFLGYLQSLGALSFHGVLPRADITVWAYRRWLLEDPSRRLVASACAGISSRWPTWAHPASGSLAPVPSPLICTALHLRRYRRLAEPFAFLSPCGLKWTEFDTPDPGMVTYNVTIRGLLDRLRDQGVRLGDYPEVGLDDGGLGRGLTVGAFGTVAGALAVSLPGLGSRLEQGLGRVRAGLDSWHRGTETLFEPYACLRGCDGGSGVGPLARDRGLAPEVGSPSERLPGPGELTALFERFDRELRLEDFLVGPSAVR